MKALLVSAALALSVLSITDGAASASQFGMRPILRGIPPIYRPVAGWHPVRGWYPRPFPGIIVRGIPPYEFHGGYQGEQLY